MKKLLKSEIYKFKNNIQDTYCWKLVKKWNFSAIKKKKKKPGTPTRLGSAFSAHLELDNDFCTSQTHTWNWIMIFYFLFYLILFIGFTFMFLLTVKSIVVILPTLPPPYQKTKRPEKAGNDEEASLLYVWMVDI